MLEAIVSFSIIVIVLFFLQLGQAQSGGLQGLTGQDLELFKENKERKRVKYLRYITLFFIFGIIILSATSVIIGNQ